MKAIAKLAQKHDLFVVADEVYREFAYEGSKHHSILSLPEIEDRAIMVDSVSKRFSMCGARVGCLATKNQDVLDAALKFAQARLSPPTFAQIAAEEALSVDESYFNEVIQEYQSRRDILIKKFKNYRRTNNCSTQRCILLHGKVTYRRRRRFRQVAFRIV